MFKTWMLIWGLGAPVSSVAVDVPFTKYTLLQNGLEVILSEDHTLPLVSVNIWYHAGPVNEPKGRTGFAHLFEHLMFQGSKHVGDDAHFRTLEAAGASLINGTTDFDRTNYFETLPSNQLELALWLESDRMGFLLDTLTQEKLDNQRQVVMNERRQSVENVPYGPSQEKLVQLLFPTDHPYYGNVIGSMDDLNAATLDDVRDFFNSYYAPNNATLVIAGDFDVTQAKAWVQKYFSDFPRRAALKTVATRTPAITQERRAVVQEPVSLAQISMAWLTPSAYTPGDAECDVLAMLLGGGKSSRLYKRLVYDLELAQDVSAHQESLALTSMFTITATAKPGVDIQRIETEIQKILDTIQKTPPSSTEIQRARNGLTAGAVKALQSLGGFGGRADMLNRYNQYVKDPGYFSKDLARYQNMTGTGVRDTAHTFLGRHQRAVVITVPKK